MSRHFTQNHKCQSVCGGRAGDHQTRPSFEGCERLQCNFCDISFNVGATNRPNNMALPSLELCQELGFKWLSFFFLSVRFFYRPSSSTINNALAYRTGRDAIWYHIKLQRLWQGHFLLSQAEPPWSCRGNYSEWFHLEIYLAWLQFCTVIQVLITNKTLYL